MSFIWFWNWNVIACYCRDDAICCFMEFVCFFSKKMLEEMCNRTWSKHFVVNLHDLHNFCWKQNIFLKNMQLILFWKSALQKCGGTMSGYISVTDNVNFKVSFNVFHGCFMVSVFQKCVLFNVSLKCTVANWWILDCQVRAGCFQILANVFTNNTPFEWQPQTHDFSSICSTVYNVFAVWTYYCQSFNKCWFKKVLKWVQFP